MHTSEFHRNNVRFAYLAKLNAKKYGRVAWQAGLNSHAGACARDEKRVCERLSYKYELEASDDFHFSPALDRLEHYARCGRRIPAVVPLELESNEGKLRAWYQCYLLPGVRSERRWRWVVQSVQTGGVVQVVEHRCLWTLREIAAHYSRLDTRCLRGH
ncbi:hypothetical protein [Trinickia mobilis]|uniref:hypothetical protein n=1 Tax=Trinickia mobilis TaxID=2816356 RepID=UPI001A8DF7E9|nr:hypothetical protein [Trinickia mobilis]